MPAPTEVVERLTRVAEADEPAVGRHAVLDAALVVAGRFVPAQADAAVAHRGGEVVLPEVAAARTGGRRRRSPTSGSRSAFACFPHGCSVRAGSARVKDMTVIGCQDYGPARAGCQHRTGVPGRCRALRRVVRGASTVARNRRRSTPSSLMYARSRSSTRPRPCGGGSPGSRRPTAPRALASTDRRPRPPRGRVGRVDAPAAATRHRAARRRELATDVGRAAAHTCAGARDRAILLHRLRRRAAPHRTGGPRRRRRAAWSPASGSRSRLPRGRIVVPPGSVPLTCAVKAWTAWLRRVRAAGRPRVPPGGPARQRAPAAVVGPRGHARRAARGRRVPVSTRRADTGRSLRRGMILAAAALGASDDGIMAQTGHRSRRLVRAYRQVGYVPAP